MAKRKVRNKSTVQVEEYRNPEETNSTRPEVGTQARFHLQEKPQKYRYDSSLSPALEWDGQNPAREQAEALIRQVLDAGSLDEAKAAAEKLRRMSGPFLNWAGKAEGQSFDVPTLPLFIHERLSTKAIIEALRSHRRAQQKSLFDLFADPQHAIVDQLRAYEHRDPWVNRLILGDNLTVMNSLIHLEKMAGQVQMIYLDPPYGVQFGSNFQPFIGKREVIHGIDDELTREPEMVQAYRDTWQLGLHSYLTFLRDRFLACRELLHNSGSIFVQIGTHHLQHVGLLLDEVFGAENQVEVISFRKKTMPLGGNLLEGNCDYLLWYVKDKERVKFRALFQPSAIEGDSHWNYVELPDGGRRQLASEEINNHKLLPEHSSVYQLIGLYPTGSFATGIYDFDYEGVIYKLPHGKCWKTPIESMRRLATANRLQPYANGSTLRYVLKHSDYPVTPLGNVWQDTSAPSDKRYIVQTSNLVVQRCLLMATDPGDLVLDPTCGSGTTAYVAEQWGRRWITIDVSRVPLALSRQRLLTATFPWYDLKEESRGPAGGFVYKRKQNKRGEEIGGIVPHVTLKSIANNEPPDEEVLVDRPEMVKDIVRVTGPFTVEAIIAPAADMQDRLADSSALNGDENYQERMLEVLRRSPRLHLPGNQTIEFAGARVPARSQWLSAEARLVNGEIAPVAVVFGPEHGAINDRLVYNAAIEARAKQYVQLVVVGFAIEANARRLIDSCLEMCGIPAVYVQATMDLMMKDLLKNMRSSQILSVCGSPEIALKRLPTAQGETSKYQVTLLGLDVFNPITMENDHCDGDDVPAWFLCTDYNDRVFHITQAFFPRTSAWDNLKRSLKGVYDDSLWDHLAGATSAPFEAGEHNQIAVKVIDDRGNELMVVRNLDEAEEMKDQLKEELKKKMEDWRDQSADSPVTEERGRKKKEKTKERMSQPAVSRVTKRRGRK